jgi:hypothetical protein
LGWASPPDAVRERDRRGRGRFSSRGDVDDTTPSAHPSASVGPLCRRYRAGWFGVARAGRIRHTEAMSANVHAGDDGQAWDAAAREAARGRTVAVVVDGEHVADVVPTGELDRLRETIEVLSDRLLMADLVDSRDGAQAGDTVRGIDAIRALVHARR